MNMFDLVKTHLEIPPMTVPGRKQQTQTRTLKQVFAYLRVSTGRQAETDLSIPDQRRQITAWCEA
jgi:site-specific DNA recombinase